MTFSAYLLKGAVLFILHLDHSNCKTNNPDRINERDRYYLATVLDDYSRYILSWRLCRSMLASEVTEVIDEAIAATGVDHAYIVHRLRLLSDNGPFFISHELMDYLGDRGISHIRGKPSHPMTQGKIELYHESLDNVTPADVYQVRSEEILSRRKCIKKRTMKRRRTTDYISPILPNRPNLKYNSPSSGQVPLSIGNKFASIVIISPSWAPITINTPLVISLSNLNSLLT